MRWASPASRRSPSSASKSSRPSQGTERETPPTLSHSFTALQGGEVVILHRIRLENYRGIDRAEFVLPTRGVTIIEGPNEIGKSSLLLALRHIFKYQDSTTAGEIRDVVPVHKDAGPEIEVEIETGPYHFTYFKRFVRNKATELTIHRPQAESLTGRPAHDRVEQILKETLDRGLWDALQVHQGTGLDEPNLKDQKALSQALDQAAGTSPVGETEIALFERATAEYAEYFTLNTGKERAPLLHARKALEEARSTVVDLEKANEEIEKDVEESARLVAEIRRLDLKLPDLESEEKEHKTALDDLAKREAELGKLEAEAAAVQQLADQAEEVAQARQALIAEETERRGKLDKLKEELERRLGPAEEAKSSIENAQSECKRAEEAQLAATALVTSRRSAFEASRNQLDIDQLRERRKRIDEAENAAEDAKVVLATNHVTEDLLERTREAEQILGTAQARKDQGGPTVRIQATKAFSLLVNGSQHSLSAGEVSEHAASDELTLELPGFAEIQISPGTSTEELRKLHDNARQNRDDLLEEAGASSLEETAKRHQARRDAEQALAERDKRTKENLRDLDLETLDAKILRLEGLLTRFGAQRSSQPPLPEGFDQAKELLDHADEALTEATGRLAAATIRAQEVEKRSTSLLDETRELESDRKVAASHAAGTAQTLAAARAKTSDEDVVRGASESAQRAQLLSAKVSEVRSMVDELAPDTIRLQHGNALRALENGKKRHGEVKVAHATVEGRIATRQEKGLFEELESARARHLHAERELEAVTRRAATAKMLFGILDAERSQAHQAYVGPLQHKIESLAKIVFGPSVRIELEEDLSIRSRTLAGRTLEFRKLSMGTKEQLGIMTRLAVGILVAQQDGAPVILDDTMGYTDPLRLRSMGAMLAHAGEYCQIIILTCTPGRFDNVGSAKTLRFSEAVEPKQDES